MKSGRALVILPIAISLVAVLLSQFPPFYTWLQSPEIEMRLGSNVSLVPQRHSLTLSAPLSIHNRGSKAGTIAHMDWYLAHEEGELNRNLDYQLYVSNELQANSEGKRVPGVEFGYELLAPGETWKFSTQASESISPEIMTETEMLYWAYITPIEIRSIAGAYFDSVNPNSPAITLSSQEAKEKLIQQYEKEYEQIIPGNYSLLVVCYSPDGEILADVAYRFELPWPKAVTLNSSIEVLVDSGVASSEDISKFATNIVLERIVNRMDIGILRRKHGLI